MSAVVESAFDAVAVEYERNNRTAWPEAGRPLKRDTEPPGRIAPATRYRQLEPTKHQIRIRAYYRYLARGGCNGDAQVDWIEAERELREELAKPGRRRR